MTSVRITSDHRVLLNDMEVPNCIRVSVIAEAGRDPEVEFRIAADTVSIDGYTNGIADFTLPSQSKT